MRNIEEVIREKLREIERRENLKKALCHFHKGNATLFEWCNSPVVYWTTPEWQEICEVGLNYFSEKVAMYHYYGTAKSTYEGFLKGENVKYKKYVYALRPILACRYIEANKSIPPVLFDELKELQLPEGLGEAVERMLEIKARSGEKDLLPQVPEIIGFIETELCRIETIAKEKKDDREANWGPLNEAFRKLLNISEQITKYPITLAKQGVSGQKGVNQNYE